MPETRLSFGPLDRFLAGLERRERWVLAIGIGFQILVLLFMILINVLPHLRGETLLLRVVPIDPRDFFRGEYVILGYEMSRLPAEGVEGLPEPESDAWLGRTVYVSLHPDPDGKHWSGGKVSVEPPSSGRYLRGTLGRWRLIEFGIESFFVQEGEGRRYEEAARKGQLSAEVVLTPEGKAALEGLVIE